jgi:hypothetical protein
VNNFFKKGGGPWVATLLNEDVVAHLGPFLDDPREELLAVGRPPPPALAIRLRDSDVHIGVVEKIEINYKM